MSPAGASGGRGPRAPEERAATLPRRFEDRLRERELVVPGSRVVVAVSGGLDSVVLLHLLRFALPGWELEVIVAHFDHGMRPGSRDDARWVEGLARAWRLPFRLGEADRPPGAEARARELRYDFLDGVLEEESGDLLATAHHADDQAETVLFRAARGTGLRGLRGIPERTPSGVVRPLLGFWREELEAYALRARLSWRPDPTNRRPSHARNVVRHEILPRLEEAVAPGARRALVRLARIARREERALRHLLAHPLEEIVEEEGEGRIVIARSAFLAYDSTVRARLLRALVRRLGTVLNETGTRAALEFTSSGASGRRHTLPGGSSLVREFDRLVLTTGEDAVEADEVGRPTRSSVEIGASGEGSTHLSLRGRTYRVEWSARKEARGTWVERLASDRLTFPLRLRGWAPGDRIRLSYGSKKLTKLFAEARIPAGERRRRLVLTDGRGEVLWVPGVARSVQAPPGEGKNMLTIGIEDADDL